MVLYFFASFEIDFYTTDWFYLKILSTIDFLYDSRCLIIFKLTEKWYFIIAVKSPKSVWYALLSFRHCNIAQLISSVELLNNVNIMYSKILPVTEGNYEQFDRGRYFILCKFHKSNILFARRDMNGSETWPRIWNISNFSNYLCAFFFFKLWHLKILGKYSLENIL